MSSNTLKSNTTTKKLVVIQKVKKENSDHDNSVLETKCVGQLFGLHWVFNIESIERFSENLLIHFPVCYTLTLERTRGDASPPH